MNNQQFQLWWDHATVVIPSLVDWAAKIRKHPDKDFDNIFGFWRDRLSRVDLSAAKDAIEKLAQDNMPKYNRDFDAIPFSIERLAGTTVNTASIEHFVDGQRTVKCKTCDDCGTLQIWHPNSVQAMRSGTFGKASKGHQNTFGYVAAVRCCCEAGGRLSKNIVLYDSSQHCICESQHDTNSVVALKDFCNPHNRAKEMAGYDSGLAAYNEELF